MSETFALVPPRSIVGIGAYRDGDRVASALKAALGVDIPTTPHWVEAGGVIIARLAPARLLASGERDAKLPARLREVLHGLAAITDQSDMWESYELSGPRICDVLAKIVPVDVAPAYFPVGAVALTRAGHLDVRLSHIAEFRYELATTRSYGPDLRHAITTGLRGSK